MSADVMRFGKVALLLGGTSAEREISLRSGRASLEALRRMGVNVHPVDPIDGLAPLIQGGFDRAMILLHGRGGEDGQIQGLLEMLGIPYTGSGVLGSALGMDKHRSKLVWQGAGLPTPKHVLIQSDADLDAAAALGFPLFIKPDQEGSSLGVARVESADALESAWQSAVRFNPSVLAEPCIQGGEYTCAVLGQQALPLIRLETPNVFYDFEAKYQSDNTQYHCPCGLSADQEARLGALCVQAFEAIGATGWGRVDFMLDEAADGGPQLLEVNTVPGMTDHSLVPMAAKAAGMDFDQLCLRILETSLEAAL